MAEDESTSAQHETAHVKSTNVESAKAESAEQMGQDKSAKDDVEVNGNLSLALLIAARALAQMMVGMDLTILATMTDAPEKAVPTISSYFKSLQDISWYGGAYFIAISSFTPIFGKIYQWYSPKWTFLICISIFALGSLIGGVSPSSGVVVGARVIMGVGAAGILSGSASINGLFVPREKQPGKVDLAWWASVLLTSSGLVSTVAMGIVQGAYVVAAAMGPLIGGALVTEVTWRWCFYLNLPISGLTAAVVLLIVPSHDRRSLPDAPLYRQLLNLDILGFLLYAGSATMLIIALQTGGVMYPWSSSVIIGLFCGSAVTAILFAGWQWNRQERAMIPPKIFLHRTVASGFLVALFGQGSFQVMVYYLPIWFQSVQGASALSSGVRYLPTAISDMISAVLGGFLIARVPYYNPFLLFGLALFVIGTGLCTTFTVNTTTGDYIGYQILIGIGSAYLVQVPIIAVQRVLPRSEVAIGSVLIILGGTLSASIFLGIAQIVFQQELRDGVTSDFSDSQTVQAILEAGALGFRKFIHGSDLQSVLESYNYAVTRVFYISMSGGIAAWIASWGIEWVRLGKAHG